MSSYLRPNISQCNLKPHTVSRCVMTSRNLLRSGQRIWMRAFRLENLFGMSWRFPTACFYKLMRKRLRKRLFIQFTFPSRHECFDCKDPRNSPENHLWSRGSWAIGLSCFSLVFFHFVLCSVFPGSRAAAAAAVFSYRESERSRVVLLSSCVFQNPVVFGLGLV